MLLSLEIDLYRNAGAYRVNGADSSPVLLFTLESLDHNVCLFRNGVFENFPLLAVSRGFDFVVSNGRTASDNRCFPSQLHRSLLDLLLHNYQF